MDSSAPVSFAVCSNLVQPFSLEEGYSKYKIHGTETCVATVLRVEDQQSAHSSKVAFKRGQVKYADGRTI